MEVAGTPVGDHLHRARAENSQPERTLQCYGASPQATTNAAFVRNFLRTVPPIITYKRGFLGKEKFAGVADVLRKLSDDRLDTIELALTA